MKRRHSQNNHKHIHSYAEHLYRHIHMSSHYNDIEYMSSHRHALRLNDMYDECMCGYVGSRMRERAYVSPLLARALPKALQIAYAKHMY